MLGRCVRTAIALLLLTAFGLPHVVQSQAPLVQFSQQTLPSEVEFETPCGLIDGGAALACAYGATEFTGIRIFNKLWGIPTLAESISMTTGTYTSPSSIAGNHKGFLLVANGGGGVYCNTEKIETLSVVRPIRRLGQTANGYFAMVFSGKLVIGMEHRYIPGSYYQALSTAIASPFVAVALSEEDGVLIAVTNRMALVRYAISINPLGRISVQGGATSLDFQVQVPDRYGGLDPFFLIRERPTPTPTSTTRGYREVLVGKPASNCAVCSGCQPCPATPSAAQWMVLTSEYRTSNNCNDVLVTQNDGTTTYCARYDAGTQTFGVVFCTPTSNGLSKPTRFSTAEGCVAKWRQQPPYFNVTNKTTNSLWDLPSAFEYHAPPLNMTVPTFVTEYSFGTFYQDAANIGIVNGLVVAAVVLQGKDCHQHVSTTIVAGATGEPLLCSEQSMLTFYSVALPLAVHPSTGIRTTRQFMGYKSSISQSIDEDHPPSVIAYEALNGTIVVAAGRVSIATSAASGASTENLNSMPYSARNFVPDPFLSSRLQDLITVGRDLYVSYDYFQRSVGIYKIPRNRVGTTPYYYTSLMRSNQFNYSENYAYCATQIEVKIFIVDVSQQSDGLMAASAFVAASVDAFVPDVLDSSISGNAANGYTVSLFQAPCAVPTTQTIRMRISSTIKFDVVLTLLPGGVQIPSNGSGGATTPTPAPPPPPTPPPPEATDSVSATVTTTVTEAQTLEVSDTVGTASLSQSNGGGTSTSSQDGLTASRVRGSVTRSFGPTVTPEQHTAEPTLSTPLAVFDALPSNITDWLPVPPTPLPYPQDALAAIAVMASDAPPPSTYVVRFTLPFAGVGRVFVASDDPPSVAHGSIVTQRDDGTEMLLRTSNATEAHRFVLSAAIATNPDVLERNLTGVVPLNLTVWGEVVSAMPQQQANVAVVGRGSWLFPLAVVPLNRGPLIAAKINCSRSVIRGVRFDLDMGSVLTHPLHVRLRMSVSGLQYPIPPSINVRCIDIGNCSIRGVAIDDEPIRYRIGASDGFFATFALCALYPYYLSLRVARAPTDDPLVFDVKAASPFVLTIPMDLFISSLSVTMLAVTLDEGYPLPSSINFMAPNTLRGIVPTVQLLRLRVKAVDLYSEAYYGFALNATDRPPQIVGTWAPVRILAGQSFATVRYHANHVMDPDPEDAVVCTADPAANAHVPPWLSVATVSPGTLQISGNAPVSNFPHDQNLTLWLQCSDGVLHTPASVVLHMQEAVPPQPTAAALPQFVAAAEEPFQATMDAAEFYVDPTGGKVVIGAALTSDALATWLQIQRVSDTILRISGVPSVDEATRGDGRSSLGIEVMSVFGNKTVGYVDILVTATTWQLIVQYSTLIYSLLGVVFSIVSLWFYWVPLVNTVTLPWRRVECPLTTPGMFEEEPDGAVSYALHKTCHDVIGYVALSDKVAGKVRRRLRCLGKLASYWDLLLSHDERLPKWLHARGDHRAVFSVDAGDDGVLVVVVHERNIYGVVLREYTCDYRTIVAFLVSHADMMNDDSDSVVAQLGGATPPRKRRIPRPLLKDKSHGRSSPQSSPTDGEEDAGCFDDMFCEEGEDALPTPGTRGMRMTAVVPCTGAGGSSGTTETLRDARRAHLRMEAMRHQLGQDMHRMGGDVKAHLAQTVDARMVDVGQRIDGLAAMLTAWMASSPTGGDPRRGGVGRGGGGGRSADNGGSAANRPTMPTGTDSALYANDDRNSPVDLLYELDNNRVQDPLAELNRAMASGRTV